MFIVVESGEPVVISHSRPLQANVNQCDSLLFPYQGSSLAFSQKMMGNGGLVFPPGECRGLSLCFEDFSFL